MFPSSHCSPDSTVPLPQTGVLPPLLLDELDALEEELAELLADEALDELDALEELDELLDVVPDELLDDEPDVLPAEDALDALLDEELPKSEPLVTSMAPSVSKAQACAMTLRARANETIVQIVNERECWRMLFACALPRWASSGNDRSMWNEHSRAPG